MSSTANNHARPEIHGSIIRPHHKSDKRAGLAICPLTTLLNHPGLLPQRDELADFLVGAADKEEAPAVTGGRLVAGASSGPFGGP